MAGRAASRGRQPAPVRVSADWLALANRADAAARAADLVDLVGRTIRSPAPWVIHDLGSGTGSMARWLAPRLPGPQHWILYDRDADLLASRRQRARTAPTARRSRCETRAGDITRLGRRELAGASLITASALLDMLTADELDASSTACVAAGCPVLLTLSVIGRVELTPADPLDDVVAAASMPISARVSGDRRLLGPDAVRAAVDAFTRLGADVIVRPSPWRLGPAQSRLAADGSPAGWVRPASSVPT